MDSRFDQLVSHCEEINELKQVSGKSFWQRPPKYWFTPSGIRKRIEYLEDRLFKVADIHLMNSDDSYRELAKNNIRLVASEDIFFKVTTTSIGMVSNYASQFRGSISDNGHAYCHSVEGNFPLAPVAQYMFPKAISGQIDHWGNIHLKTSSTGMAIFRTLPTGYSGRILANGKVGLRILKTETDILTGGWQMIDKLMANVFGSNSVARVQFSENRRLLREKVNNLIDEAHDASIKDFR